MSTLWNYLVVFFLSMLPIIELRGAIPVGVAFGIPYYILFPIAIAGNMLPVPFILFFIRKIIEWMKTTKWFGKFALWLEKKSDQHAPEIQKYATFGLFIFVVTPFPGTGAWMGSLVAALLKMPLKNAMLSIFGGVLISSIMMAAVSYGAFGFLKIFV